MSIALEECVCALAATHPDTRFVKLHFEDAEMEPAGVPALIAYRNGDKFAGLVPLIDEIPEDADVSATTLERVMQRYAVRFILRSCRYGMKTLFAMNACCPDSTHTDPPCPDTRSCDEIPYATSTSRTQA